MKLVNLSFPHYDLVKVDYLLDICYIRNTNCTPYLVISGNLTPEFRIELAQKIINTLDNCLNELQNNDFLKFKKFESTRDDNSNYSQGY